MFYSSSQRRILVPIKKMSAIIRTSLFLALAVTIQASLMLNNTAPAGCGAGSKGEQTCAAQNKTCCCDPVHSPSCCCNPGLGCGSPYSGNFCGNPPSCPASGTSKCGPVNPCCCTKWEGVAPNATCTQHVCCDVPEFGCSAYGGCCVPPGSSNCYQPQQPEWYVTG